ncbi:MAG: competence/damage-inducible protein A [Clostridia bacterium]
MKCEIIAVGTELLMGQISNTNAQYLSHRLPEVDVYVYYHTSVGDNPGRMTECLSNAMERCELVIMTGGLGPTQDDITKEIVAQHLGRKLVPDEETLARLEKFFRERKAVMCPNNEKQAYYPEGAILVKNKNGTAPGCIIEEKNNIIILLPGPPWEMTGMFEDDILPYLENKAVNRLESRFLRLFGIGESSMENAILDIVGGQTNPTIAPYAKKGEVTIRVTAKYEGPRENAEIILSPVIAKIYARLGDYIYSDRNEELSHVVADLLIAQKKTISIAESCTGGLLSAMLTENPGISGVFLQSWVSYSDASKTGLLGVNKTTLHTHGAVSAKTAEEMAEGARRNAGSDIGVSITGIAGPEGTSPLKPVGLVYIAMSTSADTTVREFKLWGDRDRIRHMACLHALDMVRRSLWGKDTHIG